MVLKLVNERIFVFQISFYILPKPIECIFDSQELDPSHLLLSHLLSHILLSLLFQQHECLQLLLSDLLHLLPPLF